MSLDATITSASGFSADLAIQLSLLLGSVGVDIEICPGFAPATWEGGFLPMKVLAMPIALSGVPISSPILSGAEIDFDDGVASLRSPASRSVVDYAMFCLAAEAIARVTGGRLEVEGGECRLSADPFSDSVEAIRGFVMEASDDDFRQVPFESWDAVE
jgi:hypothetical protein